jgi:hypothetical protein
VLFVVLVLAIVFTQWVCNSPQQIENKPLDSANYVGIQVCASCHSQIYETFKHTGMGSSLAAATQQKSSANFSSFAVYHASTDLYYNALWLDNTLFIKEYRLQNGDTIYNQIQKIDYIIGSGQHTNSHLYKIGEHIYQAPLTWYSQSQKWDLPPGFDDNNSHFSRMLDVECMSCHNAIPKMSDKSDKRFVSIGNGIDCERCHGPGSAHVNYWSNHTKLETEQHGNYIINPGKLSNDRLIDLCQRCHLQGNNVLKEGKSFLDFKPGMKLSDVFEIYLPQFDNGDDYFDMANHAARLQKSACYIKSKGEVTCITCHNPHVSVKETQTLDFNKSCESCHQTNKCKESKLELKMANNNCVKCHMPSKGAEDIPHVSVHDHKIGVHPMHSEIEKEGKPIGLYAVNNPNPAKKELAKAYLSYYEKFESNELYRQKAFELLQGLNDNSLWIHYYYQAGNYYKVVEYSKTLKDVNDDLTCFRIAKSYANLGRNEIAKLWFFKTLLIANDRPEYIIDYLSVCFKTEDLEEANTWIIKGLSEFPNNAMLWNAKGYSAFLGGNYTLSKKAYLQSLAYNPDLILTLENLAQLHSVLNNKEQTKYYLKRILAIDAKHQKAKKLLINLNSL